MENPFDLTCWFLNSRRIMELVGPDALSRRLCSATGLDGILRTNAELAIQKNAVTGWMRSNNPPTLGKLIMSGGLKEGCIFTHYTNFFFKGLSSVHAAIAKSKPPPMANGYAKLDTLLPDGRLIFTFSHEHLTSTSAWEALSGQQRQMMLGLVTKVDGNVIEAIPYVIGNPLTGFDQMAGFGGYWANHLEVHIDSIDTFSLVKELETRPSKKDLKVLRDIPEAAVKNAFAEIISEPVVPKDWGGERSDLFSSRVVVEGKRLSTAFMFKGPAQFKRMTPAELGKNGDQIDRLFTEPADLFVIQHCHEITPAVRSQMRAYAQQTGRPRLFCVIDGYDTIRILRAYKKCGQS